MDNLDQIKRDEHHHKETKYFFSLDGVKYEWPTSSVTGADVRAKLPPEKVGYAIYLESPGGEPDKQVTDAESFSLEKHHPHFYSVPPANFGLV